MTIRLNFNDFSSAVVTGSRSQDEFAELQKIKARSSRNGSAGKKLSRTRPTHIIRQ